MVNIPLVEDKAALRIVGFYRDEEGYIDNIGTGIQNANTLKDWGGRVIFLWEPTEKLYVRSMYMKEESRENVMSFYREVSNIDPKLIERTRANYFGDVTMCDRWFGHFMDTLEYMGLLEDTMVILTSDHGHALGEEVFMPEGDRLVRTPFVGKWGYPSAPIIDLPVN